MDLKYCKFQGKIHPSAKKMFCILKYQINRKKNNALEIDFIRFRNCITISSEVSISHDHFLSQ